MKAFSLTLLPPLRGLLKRALGAGMSSLRLDLASMPLLSPCSKKGWRLNPRPY